MTQYSAFFISLVAIALLWGTNHDTVLIGTVGLALVAAVLSAAARFYAIRQAKERRDRAITGLKVRRKTLDEIDKLKKKPLTLIDTDYDFVPPWITYVGMLLALVAVLVLGYALVIRIVGA